MTTPCACRYDQKDGIKFCPLHKAAEEMLTALTGILSGMLGLPVDEDPAPSQWPTWMPLTRAAAIERAQGGG